MTLTDGTETFASLHKPGDPLILFNAWDAGSARIFAEAGAPAIATGSWSVAAAFGYDDGEALPLELAVANLRRIVAAVELPVTVDLEGGYGEPAATVAAAIEAGAVGCNLEDGIIGGGSVRSTGEQADLLRGVRERTEPAFFINARTDLFLISPAEAHADHLPEALERARAYADAGASGLFVPGLVDERLIERVCAESPLPVNIMATSSAPAAKRLAALGVARISHGPGPWRIAMAALAEAAARTYSAS